MERYNLLIEDDGIRILRTDSYEALIQDYPGFPHENVGDFYSKTPRENLADKVIDIINQKTNFSTRELTEIVESFDNPQDLGVRIYFPEVDFDEANQSYENLSLIVFEQLVSNSQGSIVQSIKEISRL